MPNQETRPMPRIHDPRYRDQWALVKIKEKDVSKPEPSFIMPGKAPTKAPVTVVIVDWGIQRNHEAFDSGLSIDGYRAIPPVSYSNFSDDSVVGHGTMLAGIIAGVAPDVELLAIKFIDATTPPNAENAAKAIHYALGTKRRPMIINASWDVSLDTGSLADAIEVARREEVLVVTGAGNDGRDNDKIPSLPATFVIPDPKAEEFTNLISVMATDENDKRPAFSNYGKEKVHLAAPGTRIISTSTYFGHAPTGLTGSPYSPGYFLYNGTSVSAAFVSAAAAMMLSIRPDLKPKDIRDLLVESADDCDSLTGLCQAEGRLNLSKALDLAEHFMPL
jgi:subtilisin family serine protease